MTKLFIFDLDGTLITSYMDRQDKAYDEWEVYPGTAQALQSMIRAGCKVAVATNQAGVAFGFVTETDFYRKMYAVRRALGLEDLPHAVCFAHEKGNPPYNDADEVRRRKPGPNMLLELMNSFEIAREDTIFVGDMASDRDCAANAGVEFAGAGEFFDFQRGARRGALQRLPIDDDLTWKPAS